MSRVGLLFELRRAETLPGEAVVLTGNRPELGSWDPNCAVEHGLLLRTRVLMYPTWTMASPVWLDIPPQGDGKGAALRLEYKFARDQRLLVGKLRFQWERGDDNRHIVLPREPGSIWIVSHSAWDSVDEPPRVTRASFAEVLARQGRLDPGWALGRITAPGPADYLLTPRDGEVGAPITWPIEEEFAALTVVNVPPSPSPSASEHPDSGGEGAEPEPEVSEQAGVRTPVAKSLLEEAGAGRPAAASCRPAAGPPAEDLAALRRENLALRQLVHRLLGEKSSSEENSPCAASAQQQNVESSELLRVLELRKKMTDAGRDCPAVTAAGWSSG